MTITTRQSIGTALLVVVLSVLAWPLIEAAADVASMHHIFVDAFLLAALGSTGKGELALTVYWLIPYAPLCILSTAALWRRGRSAVAVASAVLGAAVAPVQWAMANHAYRGDMLNCIQDVPEFTRCGIPVGYRLTFAVAGLVTGLLIGLVVTQRRGKVAVSTSNTPIAGARRN
jgi:hypothetical protein